MPSVYLSTRPSEFWNTPMYNDKTAKCIIKIHSSSFSEPQYIMKFGRGPYTQDRNWPNKLVTLELLVHVKLFYRIVSYQTEDLASDGLLDRAMLTTGGDSTRFKAQLWCCRGQWSPSFITTAITKHRPPDEISNWLIFATEYAFETFSTKKHSSPKSTAYRRTCMRERCDPFSFVIAGVLVTDNQRLSTRRG